MRFWRSIGCTFFAAIVIVGAGGIRPAAALPTPLGPVSLGTATATPSGTGGVTFSLSGSIAVGADEFTGTATGTTAGAGCCEAALANVIRPFTLQGPGLSGTCSGHWVVAPWQLSGLYYSPAAEASLSCTLQLGLAAPAETGLSILVVDSAPPSQAYLGVFGPGPSSLPIPAPVSLGTAEVGGASTAPYFTLEYHLVGDIAFGGRVFHGHASGGYSSCCGETPATFPLTGTSPTGDLSATCSNQPSALYSTVASATGLDVSGDTLSCTGQVGGGPVGTTTFVLVVPVVLDGFGPCGRCSTAESTGVFVGV